MTIERSFDNGLTMEEYILTMAKMGYSILTEEFEKSDLREEGVEC